MEVTQIAAEFCCRPLGTPGLWRQVTDGFVRHTAATASEVPKNHVLRLPVAIRYRDNAGDFR